MIRRSAILFSSALVLLLTIGTGGEISAQNSSATPNFTEDQLVRYVQAVRSIERRRSEILRQAKNSQAWAMSVKLAEQTNTDVCALQQQPEIIKALCQELFDFSEQQIRRYGLTNREFNQITIAQQQNPQLQSRIQTLLQQNLKP